MSGNQTFAIDQPDEDLGVIDEIENDYVGQDEDVGEIPVEEVKKILKKNGIKADKEKGEIVVAGPAGKTVLGKHIRAKLQPKGCYTLYFQEGGELPECLKGKYTDIKAIEIAVENYLRNANKKVA